MNLRRLNPNLYNTVHIQGRPIVSLCGSPLERIGKYIDKFLLPAVYQQPTYLRDSIAFINIIERTEVDPNSFLVCFDIKEMYHNLTHEELINAVKNAWPTIADCNHQVTLPPREYILELLKIILENNEFIFDNRFFKTTTGVPMGNSLSPELTDLRVFEVLNDILDSFRHKHKITNLYRYRDDCFFIYKNGSLAEIAEFFEHANSKHQLLKFTYEASNEKLQFLDLLMFKGPMYETRKVLDITTFHKKTENYQYLERSSCHPSHTFKGLIKGEMLRFKRCTNNMTDLTRQYEHFANRLIKRG